MQADFTNVSGLYVHVPFCDGKCFYCGFYSRPYDADLAMRYLKALDAELALYPPFKAATVYFGGGTPSVLTAGQITELCGKIVRVFDPSSIREWTIECNPGSLWRDKLRAMARAGVNRISLGAQAFDNRLLRWLGRRHSVSDIIASVRSARAAGFENLNLDLIACAPGCTAAAWRHALEQAVALEPEHMSVYCLTAEENSRLAESVALGQTTTMDTDCELAFLEQASELLAAAGYRRYEISNYARPGFECRHNLDCWQGREYIGLGPAAASHAGTLRWTNLPDLATYLAALESGVAPPRTLDALTPETKALERIVFGLRTADGIDEYDAKPRLDVLERLMRDGLLQRSGGRWRLTLRGMNLADYVGAELLTGENPEQGMYNLS